MIWWLLRTIPPRPRRIEFPPTRILVGIENREKTPAQTPWWLTLIRMLAAALVILALAEPVLNPNSEKALSGSGPVVLVVDNGWAAAAQWSARTYMIERLIAEAEGQSRPLLIVPTANATKAISLKIEAPAAARSTAAAVQPQPFAPDRMATAQAIAAALSGAGRGLGRVARRRHRPRRHRARLRRQARGLARRQLSVVETRPGQEALGAVAGVAPADASTRRCCGPRAARASARCTPCPRAASAWARPRSRSVPARRARSPPSTCRSSSGTR